MGVAPTTPWDNLQLASPLPGGQRCRHTDTVAPLPATAPPPTRRLPATTAVLTVVSLLTYNPPLQVSFGSILSPIGIGLMGYGFGAFFGLLPGGDISSLMLIYGFPISVRLVRAGAGRLHSLPLPPACMHFHLPASDFCPASLRG
jgi:hypothetical protein